MAIDFLRKEHFADRHNGPNKDEVDFMVKELGSSSLEDMIQSVIPSTIRTKSPLRIGDGISEFDLLNEISEIGKQNSVHRSLIGMGYHGTITPKVIQRNILENPGWYTQYTPYQAEIAQGRLEALLNFQTMIIDLTALQIANASLLDEGTAAAESMSMFYEIKDHPASGSFFVSDNCHPQTIAIIHTRAVPMGIRVIVGDYRKFSFTPEVFGALVQFPGTDGSVEDYRPFIEMAHKSGALVAVAADVLSLAVLIPPGEMGADAAVGSTQRFGVPMGYGGPHAAYFATRDQYRRHLPGRIIGVSVDTTGNRALRMALQTREQHIRREKATSNICTAQVLLAVMASMYAVYHGPRRVRQIAERIHTLTKLLAEGLRKLGFTVATKDFFDTLRITPPTGTGEKIFKRAVDSKFNFRSFTNGDLGVSLDEISSEEEVNLLFEIFSNGKAGFSVQHLAGNITNGYVGVLKRTSSYLEHPVFNKHHSESEMMRYMRLLESRDLSLTTSMIPLGSCTMKLNASTEMLPITWPEFSSLHPFAPIDQAAGYRVIFDQLSAWLQDITGFAAVSLQPNAGAQGEYTGLLVIRAYNESRGEKERTICLIPSSAHGTNPASAVMAGMQVVVVRCDSNGNIDLVDLKEKAVKHRDRLSAFMVTYPSTHGVFEESIKEICRIVHENGGQVYMDGANMNAQVGLCRPAELGADVCHLNLHKTFCIPHGGGGPGVGPIGVAKHLIPFLPNHPVIRVGGESSIGPVSAAPWGSASILLISWAYIRMMGSKGLTDATRFAILNANYMSYKLEKHFAILYKGSAGRVAHEFIIDLRPFKSSAGVEAEDVAKRLMDYGFHAPTVSFPVAGTMMIEPTESESLDELDRFCDALVLIREEIRSIESGESDRLDNPLKNAPHTAASALSDEWSHAYTRDTAVFPAPWTRVHKFWPSVSRVNNAYGDRNLICSCPPIESYEQVAP